MHIWCMNGFVMAALSVGLIASGVQGCTENAVQIDKPVTSS